MAREKMRRRMGIAALTAVFVLVPAALFAVGLCLYTEGGTRFAAELGRRWYDDSIPGEVDIGSISGRLGDRFVMRGIALRDRASAPLISVRELEVEWSPASLLGGRLLVERVTIRGAQIHLNRELSGIGFADLAPEETRPEATTGGLGPDLPFTLLARVRLEDATVFRSGPQGGGEVIAHLADLEMSLSAVGTRARLGVDRASGIAPGAGSADLRFAASWDEPVAALTDLRATTDLGSLSVREAAIDVAAQIGLVEALVDGNAGILEELFGIPLLEDVAIPITAVGGPDAFRASLAVMDGPEVAIEISATGSVRPVLDVLATMASADGVRLARIHAVRDGRFSGGRIERACAVAEVDDLALLGGALSRLFDLPKLGGALAIEAGCERTSGAPSCRGDAHLAADRLELAGERISHLDATAAGTFDAMEVALDAATSRGDHLRARAAVDLRDGVAVTLHQLGGRYRGAAAHLARPATVSYRRRSVAVRDLELRVAGGTVFVDGDIEPDAASDLTARVVGVRLDRLPEGIGGHGLKGRVGLSLRVFGESGSPRGALSGSVKGLELGARPLGDLRLAASYDGTRLTVDGALAEEGGESVRLHASAPLHRILGGPAATPLGRLPISLVLTIRGVALEPFAALVPGSDLAGEIDARLVVEGTVRSPRAALSASVRRLSRRNLGLGELELFASLSEDRVYVDFEYEGGVAESLRLVAEAEIALSPLGTPMIRWARGGLNVVELVARGLRLDLLRAVLPGVEIDGVADVDAQLRGGPDNPYVRLEINARKVAVGGLTARPLRLLAEHSDGVIAAEVRMEGGPAGRIEAFGQVPVQIALDALPRWRRERPHEIDASAVGLDLGALRQIAALNGIEAGELPVDGIVDLSAVLSGTPSSPLLEAWLSSDDLSWKTRRLGETTADLEIGRGTARLHAQIVHAKGSWADLVATAPCDLAIHPFELRWDRRGAHAFRLQAVGIDKAVLSPFWEAPAGSDLRLDIGVDGAGSSDDFAMRGEWNGRMLFKEGAAMPFRGRMAADLHHQSVDLEIGTVGSKVASIAARAEVAVAALLRGEGRVEDALLAAEIRMPGLDLKPLGFLSPTGLYGIEGRLRGEITVDGTIGAPRARGHLALEDGAITVVEMGQRLRDISVRAVLDGRRVFFEDMRFSSGEGRGTADGELVVSEDGSFHGTTNARLRRFPVVKPGLPELTVDSAVTFSLTGDRKSTEALIALRDTRIKLLSTSPSRAPKRLPPTGEITFRNIETGVAPVATPDSGKGDPRDARPMRLVIDVSDPIEITGPDVSMHWSGVVTAVSAAGRNAVSGRIAAEDGRFWLLDNAFVIDSGEVSLPAAGPLDPYIRLVARTEAQSALVTVEIKGRLSRPDLTLTSDPPMSQYQILTLLLTGRSDTGEGGEDSEEVRAQGASLLLALNNPALEEQLNDRLGVDRIGLSMGENVDEPIVAVGKRLGRHFYVETEYHHNAPSTENRAGGRVEYYINPRWSIETFYGDANKGGIDLFWHLRFGRHKPSRLVPPGDSDAAPSGP